MIRLIIDEGLSRRGVRGRGERQGVEELRRAVDAFDPATRRPAGRHPRRRLRGGGADVRDRGPRRGGGRYRSGHVVGTRHAARVPHPCASTRCAGAISGRASWCGIPAPSSNPCRAFAQASGPFPSFGFEPKLRVRGLGDTLVGPSTAAIADEILEPGDGQIRALVSCGGNPMAAWPDQLKVRAALEQVELLVQFDPWMSSTAKLARLRDRADAVARGPGHDQLRRHASRVRAGIRPAETVGAVHARRSSRRRRAAT